jgi:hypothetical protein
MALDQGVKLAAVDCAAAWSCRANAWILSRFKRVPAFDEESG